MRNNYNVFNGFISQQKLIQLDEWTGYLVTT